MPDHTNDMITSCWMGFRIVVCHRWRTAVVITNAGQRSGPGYTRLASAAPIHGRGPIKVEPCLS
jgi:hypothetical protein